MRKTKNKKTSTRITYPNLPKYGIGGMIGMGIGATVGSIIPGAGTAIGASIGGALGEGTESLIAGAQERRNQRQLNRDMKRFNRSEASGSMGYLKLGGEIPGAVPMGQGAIKYQGPNHEGGGIPVDAGGNPTNQQNAIAEVEGGETGERGYVFSDTLKVPKTNGKTFAEVHEMMVKRGASPEHIDRLMQLQEKVKIKEGVADEQVQQPMGGMEGMEMGQEAPGQEMSGVPIPAGVNELRWGGSPSLADPIKNIGLPDVNLDTYNKATGNNIQNGVEAISNDPYTGRSKTDKALSVASYVLPSAIKGVMALTAKKTPDTPRVQAKKVPVTSTAFSGSKADLTSQYRAILADPAATTNQKLAAQAALGRARNELASQEAGYRNQQEQFNAQSQQQADMVNQQAFVQDREVKAQERGAKMSLLADAVTSPITAMAQDRAATNSSIASLIQSTSQLSDPKERSLQIERGLKAMGLPPKRIREVLAETEKELTPSKKKITPSKKKIDVNPDETKEQISENSNSRANIPGEIPSSAPSLEQQEMPQRKLEYDNSRGLQFEEEPVVSDTKVSEPEVPSAPEKPNVPVKKPKDKIIEEVELKLDNIAIGEKITPETKETVQEGLSTSPEKTVEKIKEKDPVSTNNPLSFANKYLGIEESDPEQQATLRGFFENTLPGFAPEDADFTSDNFAWCAAFVNSVLKEGGQQLKFSNMYAPIRAKEYQNVGTKLRSINEAKPGDLVILQRKDKGNYHVAFYAGNKKGKHLMLGGNQNDRVSVAEINPDSSQVISVNRLQGIDDISPESLKKLQSTEYYDSIEDGTTALR